jgi:hypothetical protein
MSSKTALRLAVLALGAAFASAPALAQQYLGASQFSPNGDTRYGTPMYGVTQPSGVVGPSQFNVLSPQTLSPSVFSTRERIY